MPLPLKKTEGAGGTPGGTGEFLIGVAMTAAGFYVLTDRITVTSGWGRFWGGGQGGLTLLVVLIGFFAVFYNGRNPLGWMMLLGGIGFTIFEVISSLSVVMPSMPLWEMLIIFLLFGGGLGLVLKATRPHRVEKKKLEDGDEGQGKGQVE